MSFPVTCTPSPAAVGFWLFVRKLQNNISVPLYREEGVKNVQVCVDLQGWLGCTYGNCIFHLYLLISRWTHPFHCLCIIDECVSPTDITILLLMGWWHRPRSNIDHVVCVLVGSSIKKSQVNLSFLRYKIKHRRLRQKSIVNSAVVKSMKVRFTWHWTCTLTHWIMVVVYWNWINYRGCLIHLQLYPLHGFL